MIIHQNYKTPPAHWRIFSKFCVTLNIFSSSFSMLILQTFGYNHAPCMFYLTVKIPFFEFIDFVYVAVFGKCMKSDIHLLENGNNICHVPMEINVWNAETIWHTQLTSQPLLLLCIYLSHFPIIWNAKINKFVYMALMNSGRLL